MSEAVCDALYYGDVPVIMSMCQSHRTSSRKHLEHNRIDLFSNKQAQQPFSVIKAGLVVREGAGPIVSFEAFDFLLSGVKTRRYTAGAAAATCRITHWEETRHLNDRQWRIIANNFTIP